MKGPLAAGERCVVCGHADEHRVHPVREMMFGLGDTFHYLECGGCGCLRLLDPPSDWGRYYPPNYYSFALRRPGRVKRFIKAVRARHEMGRTSPLGAVLVRVFGPTPFVSWIDPVGLKWGDAVLDVGSGAGLVLGEMSDAGFTNLTGIDPYIATDLDLGRGAKVRRGELTDLTGPFDFVMMNHAFEHVADPGATLEALARLLPSGRFLMIRTPVAGTHAWRRYGTDWVQLDAPRHLFIHSEASIACLSEKAGFAVREIRYDSTDFQFWGSEQYRRGVALESARSHLVNPRESGFTPQEIRTFSREAVRLNEEGQGDQACFYLQRL